jgi:hypothetical protein
MLARWLRVPRGGPEVEIGVAIPIGCLVPLAMLLAVAISVGVLVGSRLQTAPAQSVVLRVIDDGAKPGPKVLTTQVVPLR